MALLIERPGQFVWTFRPSRIMPPGAERARQRNAWVEFLASTCGLGFPREVVEHPQGTLMPDHPYDRGFTDRRTHRPVLDPRD